MKFSLKRNSIISSLATLSYSITATQVFVTYPPISRCVLHLDRRRCWHTASRLKCLKVYQLSAWDQVQRITYCPGQNIISPSQCYVGGRHSAKRHLHLWRAITSKDAVFQGISISEQNFKFVSPFWCGYKPFPVVYAIFLGTCIFSVWRRELLLETQCFRFLLFSREVGSDNPIRYDIIPFESSMCLNTQQKELFQFYSKTDNQPWKPRGRGGGLARSPSSRSFLVNLLQLLL